MANHFFLSFLKYGLLYVCGEAKSSSQFFSNVGMDKVWVNMGIHGNSLHVHRPVSMMISQVNLCLYCKSSSLQIKALGTLIVVSSLPTISLPKENAPHFGNSNSSEILCMSSLATDLKWI